MSTDFGSLNRRDLLGLGLAGAGAAMLPGCGAFGGGNSSNSKRPNVLFISVDDLRPELGCYGHSHVISPNIDSLAGTGLRFDRAYCQQAVCNPSRASLMTGLRPDTIKVWDLVTDFRKTTPGAVTLTQHFMAHDYHCLGLGKIYHNNLPDDLSWSEPKLQIPGYPFDPDAVYLKSENLVLLEKKKAKIIAAGRQKRYIDRFGEWYLKCNSTECMDVPDNAYFDGAQTDLAISRLASLKKQDKPFFFGLGYYRPHLPFNAPKRYWDMYDRKNIPLAPNDYLPVDSPLMAMNSMYELRNYTDFRGASKPADGKLTEAQARLVKHGYLASVSYIDAQIGKLMHALDRLGLRENTIVILWGDHGWKLGEHNSYCKQTNYEIDTRVPMILSAPGGVSGVGTDALVEFVDIYPTLAELAGLPLRPELEGTSMAPLMKNPKQPWKSAAFSQFMRRPKVSRDNKRYMGYAMRTDRYRYVEWRHFESREVAARELYDHQNDPAENHNLANLPQHTELITHLAKKLAAGWCAARP